MILIRYLIILMISILGINSYAKGYIDSYSINPASGNMSGWACDVRYPDDIVSVHVWRDDNQFLGGTVAGSYRENAVSASCGSAHSAHGFSLKIDLPENLKDGKEHNVHVYLIGRNNFVEQLNNSPAKIKFPGDGIKERPYFVGDIVARDLNLPIISGAGHIGIWDGFYVVEVLDESNVVQKNTYENFFKRSNAWPILRTKWPEHKIASCYLTSCKEHRDYPMRDKESYQAIYAMVARANQIKAIGAVYTLSSRPTPSTPSINIRYSNVPNDYDIWPAKVGFYRCDTFISDLIDATVRNPGYKNSSIIGDKWPKRIIDSDISSWHKKYSELDARAINTPVTLYNKLKEWQ